MNSEILENGLIIRGKITLPEVPGAELYVTPTATGSLLLLNTGNRVTWFPRSMVLLNLKDGRTGVGWVEWNIVKSQKTA